MIIRSPWLMIWVKGTEYSLQILGLERVFYCYQKRSSMPAFIRIQESFLLALITTLQMLTVLNVHVQTLETIKTYIL